MSEESAKAFLKKVGEDKELQEKVKGADSEKKFLAVANESGFDFTVQEWDRVINEELSDNDLAAATGGGDHDKDLIHIHKRSVRSLYFGTDTHESDRWHTEHSDGHHHSDD
jgi:predicted ribosomally synthesized peptide with nif11-like leader